MASRVKKPSFAREKDKLDKERRWKESERKKERGRERKNRVGDHVGDQVRAGDAGYYAPVCPQFLFRGKGRLPEAPVLVRNPRRVIRSIGPR